MHYSNIEFKIPVFFSCLGALVCCALLAIRLPAPVQNFDAEVKEFAFEVVALDLLEESPAAPTVVRQAHFFAHPQLRHDLILELYRQPGSQSRVIDFFTEICPAPDLAEAILANADVFNISPALAFSLAWEESRFNPQAVNTSNQNGSIDRGLFQLNSFTFSRLSFECFFDPHTSAYYGMRHLRFCLDTGGSEIAALAIYNAGTTRVVNNDTPMRTLNYVNRILDNRRIIEDRFLEREILYQALHEVFIDIEEEPEPEPIRVALLKPLGIR